MSWKKEYGYPEDYHRKVVEECVLLMGDEHREFWEDECSFETEYAEGMTPDEVAVAQYEALAS